MIRYFTTQDAPPAAPKPPQLQRHLQARHAFALALGCIIGWGAFVMPGTTLLPVAGPAGAAIAIAIACAVMACIAVNIGYMMGVYPSNGGTFIFAEKTFGRTHGFVCAWALVLAYVAIVPLNATALALVGRSIWNVLQFGFHYTVAGYDVYFGELLLALDALLVFGLACIMGAKRTGTLQSVFVCMLVGGTLIVAACAVFSPVASVQNLEPYFSPGGSAVVGIASVVAIAPWAFVGFDTLPQSVEEIDFDIKRAGAIMVGSIVAGRPYTSSWPR